MLDPMQMEFRSSDDPQQLLDHLRKTPEITRLDMELMEMNGVEGKKIGEAVASLKSLETLVLKLDSELEDEIDCDPDSDEEEEEEESPESPRPMDAFLTAAFLGEKRNTSVRSLIIAGSGTDGDMMRLGVLPEVIETLPVKELVFQWHGDDGATLEEIHLLLDALVKNTSIESLTLWNLIRCSSLPAPLNSLLNPDSLILSSWNFYSLLTCACSHESFSCKTVR